MQPVLLIFGLGPTEFIVIGLIVLVLFGSRLPRAAKGLGQSIKEFKKGVREGEDDAPPPQIERHPSATVVRPSSEDQPARRD